MKKTIMSKLSFIFPYYTIIILATTIYNLLSGFTKIRTAWFIELFIFLIIFNIIDCALMKIEFKNYLTSVITEATIGYFLFLTVSYIWDWIQFTPTNLLSVTLLFTVIVVIGASYFHYRYKLHLEEINQMLLNRKL